MAIQQTTSIGTLLRRYRIAAALTQEELAERAGISAHSVSDLERGIQRKPYRETIRRLAEALELTSEECAGFQAAARDNSGVTVQVQQATGVLQIGSFLGAVPSGPLVCREHEVARILHTAEEVRNGAGRCIILHGDAGQGKTRIAQEFAVRAAQRGFLVVTGRCFEPEEGVPFYPFLEALSSVYRLAPPAMKRDLSQRWPYLAWLLPDINVLRPVAGTGEDGQQRLLRSVAEFLKTVAVETPVALILDDLHWSDSASVHLLRHLAHHARNARILLAGTVRSGELSADHPLRQALLELDRAQLVEHIHVEPFSQGETAELTAALLGSDAISPDIANLVFSRSQGNSLFTQELVRSMIERGEITRSGDRWILAPEIEHMVPAGIMALVAHRVQRLGAMARATLEEASVLGQSFNFDDLHGLGEHSELEVEEVLSAAQTAGLISVDGQEIYAFQHTLIQQSIYYGQSLRRRRRLHRAAAEALERLPAQSTGERAADLAHHFLQAGEDARALPYIVAAGDRASFMLAPVEAQHRYRTALSLAQRTGDTELRANILERLGWNLRTTGAYTDALEALEEAVALYRSLDDSLAEGSAVAKIGWVLSSLGRPHDGITLVRTMAQRLEQFGASAPLVEIYNALGHLYQRVGRFAERRTVAERAANVASSIGDERMEAQGELNRGIACMELGNFASAVEILQHAVPKAERAGDAESMIRALVLCGNIARAMGNHNSSRALLDRAMGAAEQLGSPNMIVFALVSLGDLVMERGDWGTARVYYESAVESCSDHETSFYAVWPQIGLADLCLAESREEEWSHHKERTRQHPQLADTGVPAIHFQRLLAEHALLKDRPESALGHLDPVLDQLRQENHGAMWGFLHYRALAIATEAWIETGQLDRAGITVTEAIERASMAADIAAVVRWLRIQGLLQTQQDLLDQAAVTLDRARTLAQSIGIPFMEPQILVAYARLARRSGNTEAARHHLRRAATLFGALGARGYVNRVQMELAGL